MESDSVDIKNTLNDVINGLIGRLEIKTEENWIKDLGKVLH